MAQTEKTKGADNAVDVFIVDDDPLLRELAVLFVKETGFSYREFPNAEHAWEAYKLADPPPRLIISDYFMAKMTGLDLLVQSKAMNPSLKTLLVSGTVEESVIRGANVDGFLAKPYRPEMLVAKINEFMNQTRPAE
ncbi:MAG: response regulator [Verrucomicrobiota bacterium]